MGYSKLELDIFTEIIHEYPTLLNAISKKQDLILQNPYHYSHGLGQGKWCNLKGLRSVHMKGAHYVILIAICEDCFNNGHAKLNIQYCGGYCNQEPEKRVVFISFGKHDEAYGRL